MVERNACSEPKHNETHMHFPLPRPLDLLHLRWTTLLIETEQVNRVSLSSSTGGNNYSSVDLHQLPYTHHCFLLIIYFFSPSPDLLLFLFLLLLQLLTPTYHYSSLSSSTMVSLLLLVMTALHSSLGFFLVLAPKLPKEFSAICLASYPT